MSSIWQTLGFEQISVEPVVTDPKEPYALRPEDVPQLLEEYDKLAVELLKRQKRAEASTSSTL